MRTVQGNHCWSELRCRRVLKSGRCVTISSMVTAEQAKSSYASRVLHLMLLAPEVVAATLTAQQPEGIRRLELLEPLPAAWDS